MRTAKLLREIVYLCISAGCVSSAGLARADVTITMLGETQTIDFQDYTGAGLTPGGGGGALDSNNWALDIRDDNGTQETNYDETVGPGVFGRGLSTGGVSDRGFYSFETGGGNRALGVQLGDVGFSSALPSLLVTNETGFTVDYLNVRYDIWVYNDSNGSNYFDLEFRHSNAVFDPVLFDTPTTADGSPAWVRNTFEYDLFLPQPGFIGVLEPLDDGDSTEISWSGGGLFDALNGFDEMAIDNIQITAYSSTAVPEPGVCFMLCAATGGLILRRNRRAE